MRDKYGRNISMNTAALIGGALQRGSINIAVLLVARFILLHHWMWDWNDGVLTPIFHAEISLPMACLSANMVCIVFFARTNYLTMIQGAYIIFVYTIAS
jgi:hypothetical protein